MLPQSPGTHLSASPGPFCSVFSPLCLFPHLCSEELRRACGLGYLPPAALGHGQSVFPACLLLTPLICPLGHSLLMPSCSCFLCIFLSAFYLAQPGALPHPLPCLGSLSTLPAAWDMSLISYASFLPQGMLACFSGTLEGRARVSFFTKLGPLEPTRQESLKGCRL